MKFWQLIVRKIINIVATRYSVLKLKCTKIDLGWGYALEPSGGLTLLPQTPSWNKRDLLREGEEREGEKKGEKTPR